MPLIWAGANWCAENSDDDPADLSTAGSLEDLREPWFHLTQHALGVVLVAKPASDQSGSRYGSGPDVAFVRANGSGHAATRVFPGLVWPWKVSPNDRASELIAKVQDWLDGVAELSGRRPRTHSITVYRSRNEVMVLTRADTLTGGDVVPGFSVAVRDIFA